MYKVAISKSLENFKLKIDNEFTYTLVTPENVIEILSKEPYSGLILTPDFIFQMHKIRSLKNYENAIIISFSDNLDLYAYSDLTYSDTINELSFEKAIREMKALLSPLHKVGVFSFLKRLMILKDFDIKSQLYRVPEMVKFILNIIKRDSLFSETLTDTFIKETIYFSIFHDLGKLTIVNENLNFTGVFDDNQRKIMKLHTTLGYELFEGMAELYPDIDSCIAKNIIYYHHEKWDGTGYPKGLKGNDIPLEARIVAIADVYDALRSERKYKKCFSHEKSFGILIKDKGTHFDPVLINLIEKYEDLFEKEYNKFFEDCI